MRLINEIAYQERLAKIPMEERTFRKAVEVAEDMPAIDAVPVVRCKDYTYMEDAYACNGFLICPASNMEITDNDFCSYGERKDGDG